MLKVFLIGAFAACGCVAWRGAPEACVRYVDEFDLSASSCGLGKRVRPCASVDGNPLTLGGKVHARGFGTRPEGAVAFRSNGKVSAFDAIVGIDADSAAANRYKRPAAVIFRVWADQRIVWESGDVKDNAKPIPVHVDLAGAKEIVLETVGAACWYAFEAMNADWADARFSLETGATLDVVEDADAFAQLGVLTPPERKEPRINGADIWGVRPTHPVIFRVATSGERPMRFTAVGLPHGVTLDAEKGILGGVSPRVPGNYDIVITASNRFGSDRRTIRLAVGDTIALTPPMGWNSWNTCCYRLTQAKAMAAAKAMDESGLGDHGWSYVNLDDWWMMNNSGCPRIESRKQETGREDVVGPARTSDGKILSNRSFPDMKGLTDYIHSLGFKAGIYSGPGPRTCGLCEASYGHELQDAERFAEWGFDYLKYDWCTYNLIFKKQTGLAGWTDRSAWDKPQYREYYVKPYRLMGECLKRQPRDILYSFCQYGMGCTEEWGRATGANCWRTYDDLKDQWLWMEKALDSCRGGEFWKYTGTGFWADPDMMIVGEQYSFGYDHPTFLTPNEQYTHVSLWTMVCSPMLLGCDLTKLDAFTRSLLVNDEVIAIGQDRLGQPARRYRHNDLESVWARPLANGDIAVALVNRYPMARTISVMFSEVGAGEHGWVRDCWRQRCEGKHAGSYSAEVPPHATKLIRIRNIDCVRCE